MSELGKKRDVHVEDHSIGLATMKEALEFDPKKNSYINCRHASRAFRYGKCNYAGAS